LLHSIKWIVVTIFEADGEASEADDVGYVRELSALSHHFILILRLMNDKDRMIRVVPVCNWPSHSA